jgi:CBS domain-containing protein
MPENTVEKKDLPAGAPSNRRRCSEIMTRNVTIAAPEMTLQEAAALLREADVGALPVVSEGKLVGIITDRDIVIRSVAEGMDINETKAAEVMTAEVFSASPETFVFEAIRLMGDKQIRRVPVINEAGELCGMIAMADIALEMEDEREIAETLEDISSGAAFWRKG